MLLLKLLITPALMWTVSLASRRWGGFVGGLLAGLPITSAPISVFFALEEGKGFAGAAAVSSLKGLAAVTCFYIPYILLARRCGVVATVAASLVAYLIAASVLLAADLGLASLFFCNVVLVGVALAACGSIGVAGSGIRGAWWDTPARMVVSTSMVLIITLAAPFVGATVAGFLAPVPVVALTLTLFVFVQQGPEPSIRVLKGINQGTLSVMVFYVAVRWLLERHAIAFSYGAAITLTCLSALAIVAVARYRPAFIPRPDRTT